jgi:hypothetical protein
VQSNCWETYITSICTAAGTWSGAGFVWEDGRTAPTELPTGSNNNVPGYSHWVVQSGQSPEPTGEACAYSDRAIK